MVFNVIAFAMEQVAPAELEHLLNSHADVVEASVVPYVTLVIFLFTIVRLFTLLEKTQFNMPTFDTPNY